MECEPNAHVSREKIYIYNCCGEGVVLAQIIRTLTSKNCGYNGGTLSSHSSWGDKSACQTEDSA